MAIVDCCTRCVDFNNEIVKAILAGKISVGLKTALAKKLIQILMPGQNDSTHIFTPAHARHNAPTKIVTLGHYYPQGKVAAAKNLIREVNQSAYRPDNSLNPRIVSDHIGWTRLINALNMERQWPLKQLVEMLDPMLEPGTAIAVVPPHRAYQAFWPLRTLAQRLATSGRTDATSCLVRHTTIRRIIFGDEPRSSSADNSSGRRGIGARAAGFAAG